MDITSINSCLCSLGRSTSSTEGPQATITRIRPIPTFLRFSTAFLYFPISISFLRRSGEDLTGRLFLWDLIGCLLGGFWIITLCIGAGLGLGAGACLDAPLLVTIIGVIFVFINRPARAIPGLGFNLYFDICPNTSTHIFEMGQMYLSLVVFLY